MRILILSPALPFPPNWGFGIRVFEILRLLARRHSVSLLAYAGPEEGDKISALEQVCEAVHTVPRAAATTGDKRLAQLLSMASPRSFQRRNNYSDEMQQKLRDLAAQAPYDVIQVESSPLACFEFDPRSALVLVEHDIVYELLYRMYQTERAPARRLYNRVEYAKLRREEIRGWRDAAGVVTTSAREAEVIRGLAPRTPVFVAPNAVDVDYFQPAAAMPDGNALVMTGFMKTRPNIDGAIFFVEEILPRILAVRPEVVFYLVGGGAPDEITRLAGPHVVVTGEVPDVRPYVEQAAVFVVPLRMGGGTRLKILEGLSMKKPMVSTSLGCEGIDVRDREHLLVADGPAPFADAVLELLNHPALGAEMANRGRTLVEGRYQWRVVADRLEAFYLELLRSRPTAGAAR